MRICCIKDFIPDLRDIYYITDEGEFYTKCIGKDYRIRVGQYSNGKYQYKNISKEVKEIRKELISSNQEFKRYNKDYIITQKEFLIRHNLRKQGDYYFIRVQREDRTNYQISIHRLVGLCFNNFDIYKYQVHHKDHNQLNNLYSNLEQIDISSHGFESVLYKTKLTSIESFILIHPDGKEELITDIQNFYKHNKKLRAGIRSILRGSRKSAQGYKVRDIKRKSSQTIETVSTKEIL